MKKLRILLFSILLISFSAAQIPVAIIDFEANGISDGEARALTDRLRNELFRFKNFQVMERSFMEEILEEQGFQLSGCTSDECVVEVGRLIGVEQMLGGSISKIGDVFTVSARIVSVETGKILKVSSYDYKGNIGGLLTQGMHEVAAQLATEKSTVTLPLARNVGAFYITSEPSGAAVWIDDKEEIGITPLVIENQSVGEHKIYLEKGGYSTETTAILQANDIKKINLIIKFGVGKLRVITNPYEADVFLDGIMKGKSPLIFKDIKSGWHDLKILKDGYSEITERIEIKDKLTEEFKADLKKIAALSINSNPSGASVKIDGESLGLTPIAVGADEGSYEIVLSKKDYYEKKVSLDLKAGEQRELKLDLRRHVGAVRISSNPAAAEVFLDGKMKGKTPLKISNVVIGSHLMEVRKQGYFSKRKNFSVKVNTVSKAKFNLISTESINAEIKSFKAKKIFWIKGTILCSVIGGYFKYSSDKHYDEYLTATDNATKLHKTIEKETRIYSAAFGIGVACLIPTYTYHLKQVKQVKLKNEYEISFIPQKDNITVVLGVNWH